MWKVAWRNLWRNRTRTIIVVTAIALSYALFLVSMGLGKYMHNQMELAALKTAGGAILIDGDGYWASQSSDIYIEDPEPVFSVLSETEGVDTAIPRVLINGLVTSTRGSAGVRLTGIVPEKEAVLLDMSQYLADGTFLDGSTDDPIVLGRKVVEDLEIELGDRVVLTATDVTGEVAYVLFHLSGILDTGSDLMDSGLAYTTLPLAQRAVGMDGGLTQIGVHLEDVTQRQVIQGEIREALGADGDGLEVMTWDEAIPEMVGFVEIDAAFNYLYAIIIFIVVCFGVANTFMMVVMERIRELGLLGALGLTPRRIGWMVLLESTILAFISTAIGFALGYVGHRLIRDNGIDMTEVYGEMEMSGVAMTDWLLRSQIDPTEWIVATVGVIVLVFVSSLYPAWRATRLDPAQAMRTYE
jgi:ABC-type lipoprotein release transport system permease subunit